MNYLSECMGSKFQEWKKGTCEFIDAPTGSGKTTYILDYVLSYMSDQEMNILYMVNRKILKRQLDYEISKKNIKQQACINVMTYQSLEDKIIQNQIENNGFSYMNEFMKYDCIVCDEAHYFLTDSTYNSQSYLSFIWIIENFYNRIRVYMSATIVEVKALVEKYNANINEKQTNWYRLNSKSMDETISFRALEEKRIECRVNRDYGFLNINLLNSKEEIVKIVMSDMNSKWIIFVNNIAEAKSIKKDIIEYCQISKDSISQIDAKGIKNGEAVAIAEDIAENQKFEGKVLITTAVLDNGVSLCDSKIKNVVIISDNEVEFIQMLGRVRRQDDNHEIKLYIYKQEVRTFSNRLVVLEKRKRYIDKLLLEYIYNAIKIIGSPIVVNSSFSLTDTVRLEQPTGRRIPSVNGIYNSSIDRDSQIRRGHITEKIDERYLINNIHWQIMDDLRNKRIDYDTIQSICFIAGGLFWLSRTAVAQIEYLVDYYRSMKEKIEKDDNAFILEQLKWINRENDYKQLIIAEVERAKTRLNESIQKFISENNEYSMNDFEKENYEDYKMLIYNLSISDDKKKTIVQSVYKTDRTISQENFKILANEYDLPYTKEGTKFVSKEKK